MGSHSSSPEHDQRDAGREDASARRSRGKRQKGAQTHAEGQHGSRTHARSIEQLQQGEHEERKREQAAYIGKRRLVEDRQQHDEGEKNSERTRLFVEHKPGRDAGPSDNEELARHRAEQSMSISTASATTARGTSARC